jgi:hypothetical protein
MMVLVDTTVWIDFFSANLNTHVQTLENLINDRQDICVCGVILTEVLQGIRNDSEFKKTRNLFTNLIFLPMPYSVYLRAAEIYRALRRKGITIRKSVDCMIAAVALEHEIPLLHNDKDFTPIEKHFGLRRLK